MSSISVEPSRGMLLVIGLALCAAGFVVPGTHGSVATAALISGAVLMVLSVFYSKLKDFSFGPGGFAATVGNDKVPSVAPALLLDVDPEKLNQFAHLICGDKAHARGLVEEVLARTQRHQKRIPPDERDAFALRALIARLKTTNESRWIRGLLPTGSTPDADDPSQHIVETLQRLDIAPRVVFLLNVGELHLTIDEIAQLLDQPPEAIDLDLQQAIHAVREDVMAGVGPAHA